MMDMYSCYNLDNDQPSLSYFFFFNDTATTEIYTLSLHDALPISCAVLLLALASPAAAQKEKKKKKGAATSDTSPIIPMSDEQQIDYMISTMLGAWQIGDIDRLHQSYADDVMIVSGTWAPTVIGWSNYVVLYQQQHARTQRIRLDR